MWTSRHLGAIVLLVLSALGGTPAQAQEKITRVLVLNAFTSDLPAGAAIVSASKARLSQRLPGKVEIYAEYLDKARFPDESHERRMASHLADKYAATRLDAIITTDPDSLRFIVAHRAIAGRDVPVIYCSVSPATAAGLNLPDDISGVVSDLDLAKTVELAALLQPGATQIVVIAGASAFDKHWAATARRQLSRYEPRYAIQYLAGLPLKQLQEQLKALPRDTIVVFTTFFVDGAGKVFQPRDILPEITGASNAPVYSVFDGYLDRGIVGGYMDTFEATGVAVADLALKTLAGGEPEVQRNVTSSFRVDWRQLRRWGLSEANLPPETVVVFKPPAFWDEYRELTLATLAAFALQTAVVVFLLIEWRRRRRAEQLLRESEERMSFAAASVNVGLWQYDFAEDRLWATDHCRNMFGIPDTVRLTRESFLEVIHPDDRASARRWMQDVIQSPTSTIGEFRVVLNGGETRWYLSRGQGKLDDKGNPARISGAFSDISARKIAEREVDAQRQMLTHIARVTTLGELSGAVAHEINQPLTAILANAEAARRMLAREPPPLHDIDEALDDIVQEGNRGGDVVKRLRSMLRRGEHKLEPVVVNDLVRSVLRLLRNELIERRVDVRLELSDDVPEISVDHVQIQQVLTNLLMNAIDAVASPGSSQRTITITTAAPKPGCVETAVTDQGPGLSAEQQVRLLEPFYTTKEHGLGLGLAICNSIVSAHGGELRVANDGGHGVRASFILPAARAG